jgi:hypothetical protein
MNEMMYLIAVACVAIAYEVTGAIALDCIDQRTNGALWRWIEDEQRRDPEIVSGIIFYLWPVIVGIYWHGSRDGQAQA